MRKMVSAAVSATLCLAPLTPALAQDYRYVGFDSPNGATATAPVPITGQVCTPTLPVPIESTAAFIAAA